MHLLTYMGNQSIHPPNAWPGHLGRYQAIHKSNLREFILSMIHSKSYSFTYLLNATIQSRPLP